MKIYFFKALLLVIISLLTVCSREKGPSPAVIAFIMGNVSKNNAEAVAGDSIKENDVITTGADSFCDIKLGESVLRIQAGSDINVSSMLINGERERIVILLQEGSLLCRVKKWLTRTIFLSKHRLQLPLLAGLSSVLSRINCLLQELRSSVARLRL